MDIFQEVAKWHQSLVHTCPPGESAWSFIPYKIADTSGPSSINYQYIFGARVNLWERSASIAA